MGQELSRRMTDIVLNRKVYRRRLRDREFRVLDLLPGSGSTPIKCILKRTSLSLHRPFEALSYVWGDASTTVKIICNDTPLHVTTNLHEALQRLRLPDSTRSLWVDAVCINQSCINEHTAQVNIMREIYSEASRVVVWLGPGKGIDVAAASQAMESIYKSCFAYAKEIDADLLDIASDSFSLAQTCFKPADLDATTWHAVAAVFALPWFTRVWCVQEIGKAKDSLVICGATELRWLDIGITAAWLQTHQIESDFDLPPEFQDIESFNALCMFEVNEYRNTGLLRILSRFRDFQATRPSDKIFALLGLLEFDNPKGCPIAIDYAKPVRKLYTEAARTIIKEHGNLSVMSQVRHAENYDGDALCPSWVPDWSTSNEEMALWIGWNPDEQFNKAGGGDAMTDYSVKEEQLFVSGLIFDTVGYTSKVMSPEMFTNKASREDMYMFVDLWHGCSASTLPYPNDDQAIRQMARTLTAGLNADFMDLQDQTDDEIQSFYAEFLYFMKHVLDSTNSISKTGDPTLMTSEKADRQRYEVAASRACDRRRYFKVSKGYHALGPAAMRKGDIVVVFRGADVPYVLRKKATGYLLIGECYLLEIMHGQVFGEFKKVCKEEKFNLM